MTLLDQVAGWLDNASDTPVPDAVTMPAKAHLLDCVGMMLAAREHPLVARAAAVHLPGGDAAMAGLVAGAACDALGLDDFDEVTRIHPGAVVVAAVLGAVAAADTPVAGDVLLHGVVTGYELTCRFGELAQAWSLHDRGWHPTGVCGTVGAAGGVAVARGVEPGAAVGLAASLASGVFELDGLGAVKGLQTGWAAQSAIAPASMVAAGYRAAPTVLDGPKGLLRALGCAAPTEDDVAAALSDDPRIKRVSFKPFSHFTDLHPATAALLEILRDDDIAPEEIAEIEVALPAGAARRLNAEFPPPSPRLARRCPQFALAAVACRADVTAVADPLLAAFDGSSLHDADILTLGARVRWSDGLPVDADGPAAVVTLRRTSGSARTVSAYGYPGDGRRADQRWGWDEVAQRYELVAPADARDLIGLIGAIDRVGDVRPFAQRVTSELRRAAHATAATNHAP